MLKIFDASKGEEQALFAALESRAGSETQEVSQKVRQVIEDDRAQGDAALLRYCQQFDGVSLSSLCLSEQEIENCLAAVDPALLATMQKAAANSRAYHEKQLCTGYEMRENGRMLGRIVRPLERVGVYVPGGTAAYPSTVLMNCIPAAVAGVGEIVLVTPPKAEGVNPAVVAAAKIAGVSRIFTVGGAQAVAALAYGTQSIPAVDKIVGPGNVFVAEAKRQVYGIVDIDMIAGPSEVLVLADETANPAYAAADLLSQLEHDALASAVLITTSQALAEQVSACIEEQMAALSRREIIAQSLKNYSGAVIVPSMEEGFAIANAIAPEHLEILTKDPYADLAKIKNAGSIFLGQYAPEPLGDYFAGTNHVLPTNGTARFSSPLSVDAFLKKMSYLCYEKQALLEDAEDIMRFAQVEGLTAHAASVRIRKEQEQ